MENNELIQFYTLSTPFQLENENQYVAWLISVARQYGKELAQVNYIFCSDDELLELNKQYLDHDYYTDILSFPYEEEPIIGDIYISIDRVKDNASNREIAFSEELLRVMAHGLLHFIGFDDHNKEDIIKMRDAEERAISIFNNKNATKSLK